jgi:hypothetical protein
MAALPPVPNVIRVVLTGETSQRNWANVFHVAYTGTAPTVEALNDYATAFLNIVATELCPLMDTNTSIEGCQCTDLTSATAAQTESASSHPGTRTGAVLPASVAGLVTYNSSFRYRGGHPRTYYLVGVDSDLADQSNWTFDFTSQMQIFASNMLTYLGAGLIDATNYTQQVAVSYVADKVARVTPLVMPISVANMQTGMATQRRRMRKG